MKRHPGTSAKVDELSSWVSEVQDASSDRLDAVDHLGCRGVHCSRDDVLMVYDTPPHRDHLDYIGDGHRTTSSRVLDHDISSIYRITNRHACVNYSNITIQCTQQQ